MSMIQWPSQLSPKHIFKHKSREMTSWGQGYASRWSLTMVIESWDMIVLETVTLGVTMTPQSAGFRMRPNIIMLHNSRQGYSLPRHGIGTSEWYTIRVGTVGEHGIGRVWAPTGMMRWCMVGQYKFQKSYQAANSVDHRWRWSPTDSPCPATNVGMQNPPLWR